MLSLMLGTGIISRLNRLSLTELARCPRALTQHLVAGCFPASLFRFGRADVAFCCYGAVRPGPGWHRPAHTLCREYYPAEGGTALAWYSPRRWRAWRSVAGCPAYLRCDPLLPRRFLNGFAWNLVNMAIGCVVAPAAAPGSSVGVGFRTGTSGLFPIEPRHQAEAGRAYICRFWIVNEVVAGLPLGRAWPSPTTQGA